AKEKGDLSKSIRLTSDLTKAQAYTLSDESSTVYLSFENNGKEIKNVTPVLYQNEPNPFESYTNISFELAEDSNGTISIFNLEGKLIRKIDGSYKKGINVVHLEHGEFEKSGVYYYELKTPNFTDIKKMMYIK
ncbi:MAG TPA: T9SS type A sorting domain-containing protein, partial [Saprospiraceae bacterium]|nr:T9SS type A sorting domain-containing protein [Saprospiraceae bacterium]